MARTKGSARTWGIKPASESSESSENNVEEETDSWKKLERSVTLEFDVPITSPPSTVKQVKTFGLHGNSWRITLQPFGGHEEKYVGIFVHLDQSLSGQNKQTASWDIEYKVAEGSFKSQEGSMMAKKVKVNEEGWGWRKGFENSIFERTSDGDSSSKKVTLTIHFINHVDPLDEQLYALYFEEAIHVRDPTCSFTYTTWLNRAKFFDFQIKYQETFFPVSKLILVSRSAVFQVMLTSTMLETTQGVLEIQDPSQDHESLAWIGTMSVKVFEIFLLFLYTNCITATDLDQHAGCLFLLAHKYEVTSLITVCVCQVCNSLTIGNFYERAMMADVLNIVQLKKMVIDFAAGKLAELVKHYKDRYFTLPSTIADCIIYAVTKVPYEEYLLGDIGQDRPVATTQI